MTTSVLLESGASGSRRVTLHEAARLLPYVTGLSGVLSIGLVSFKIWRTPHFPFFAAVAMWALAAFVGSLIVGAGLRRLATSCPDWARDGVTSWVVALELGILLLVVPVLLLAKGVPEDEMTGWTWPLINKRWLLALYNLCIATFLLFPIAIARWHSNPVADAESSVRVHRWPEWRRQPFLVIAGQIGVLTLCWYLAGPPWHLERHHRSIEWHEQVHFGALQAIAKGYLPSVGPAATAYGPGSQALMSAVMRLTRTFDLVSFRKAWAIQHFVAVVAIATCAYWWLGAVYALAVLVLAFMYSPLAFFYTLPDGVLTGFFGWANPLRYLAPLIVVPTLAAAGVRETKASTAVLCGVVWGLGAWLAQDNLSTTATATMLLLTLLWLTRTMTLHRAFRLLGHLVLGFVCVTVPVLLYYAWHGAAGAFLQAYFFYARFVAAGHGIAWWPASESTRPERLSYYLTLPFLIGCAICALWRLPALRVAPLDERRTRFLAFVCVQLVCYQSALLWSDATHLMSTMVALPFVLLLGFMDLPRWLTTTTRARWAVRVGFVVLTMLVYPVVKPPTDLNGLRMPARRFQHGGPSMASAARPDASAFTRTRPLLPDEPLFLGDPAISVREFETFLTGVREAVGQRKTYFVRIGWIAGGLIAFVADLMPAPYPIGGDLLTINDRVRAQVGDHIRTHPQDYEAFIGPSLTGPEARAFLESHPGAVILERRLGAATVYILLSHA
jgi:hypothetical protein